ncbi:MAG: arsenic efflux protein [Oscillospiraceae bacterium]|nr:arsenic efflux protein [Oscillospiraceae bacterium]
MFDIFIDSLIDAIEDSAKLIPFLYASYLFIEFIEHEASEKLTSRLYSLGAKGPFLGAVAGLMPMCGLSVTAADLFSSRLISASTLIAEFTAETDEAIPILLGSAGFRSKGLLLAAMSLAIGVISGLIAGKVFPDTIDRERSHMEHELMHRDCEEDECEKEGLFTTALLHTLKSLAFVLGAVFVVNMLVGIAGEEKAAVLFSGSDAVEPVIAALTGLIPNCAPSIILSEFYMEGLISFGSLISGLTMNAGVGLAMLWKYNRDKKQDLLICVFIFAVSVICGYAIQLIGI